MKREDLEHLIRASCHITNEYEVYIVGSQSILGALPDAPESLLLSAEADLFFQGKSSMSDVVEGAIGEESPFHKEFGYYAQGVGEKTAILPEGWKERLVRVQSPNTDNRVGYCLDPADMAAAKLIAHRPKDLDFVAEMLRHGIVESGELGRRLEAIPDEPVRREVASTWLEANRGLSETSLIQDEKNTDENDKPKGK